MSISFEPGFSRSEYDLDPRIDCIALRDLEVSRFNKNTNGIESFWDRTTDEGELEDIEDLVRRIVSVGLFMFPAIRWENLCAGVIPGILDRRSSSSGLF